MKTAEDYVKSIIPCTCDEMYKSRNMSAPDCPLCNYGDDLIASHKEYASQLMDDLLQRVADNATAKQKPCGDTEQCGCMVCQHPIAVVDKASIINTEKILL